MTRYKLLAFAALLTVSRSHAGLQKPLNEQPRGAPAKPAKPPIEAALQSGSTVACELTGLLCEATLGA